MTQAQVAALLTLIGAAVISVAQLTGKQASEEMDPIRACLFRFSVSTVICFFVAAADTGRWIPHVTLLQAGMAAFIGLIAWGGGTLLFFMLMSRDSMHRVSTISNSSSVWVVIMSVIFLGEKLFPALVAGVVLLVAGVALVSPENRNGRVWKWGVPLSLAVSVVWAFSIVLTKIYIVGMSRPVFVLIKLAAATIFFAAIYPFGKSRVTRKGLKICTLSGATHVTGDILFMYGIAGLPASIFTPLFTTNIPFGFLLSVLILREKPLKHNWLGMALIFAAAAICGYFGAR